MKMSKVISDVPQPIIVCGRLGAIGFRDPDYILIKLVPQERLSLFGRWTCPSGKMGTAIL